MCGIAGYVGGGKAAQIIFSMLKCLEYRGYDSAGIAYVSGGTVKTPKDKGKVDEVRAKVKPSSIKSHTAVGHTRWATHGVPSKVNSHPHTDCTRRFAVCHNGIIENHECLRKELKLRGHKFTSQTDTEVIAHLIEEQYDGNLLHAFRNALKMLEGSFALTLLSSEDPDVIFVARRESPLLIGLGDGENYIASDAPAFMSYTKDTVILEDDEYGKVTRDGYAVYDLKTGRRKNKKVVRIDWSFKEAEKSGYRHFMLKEIHEEPAAARNAFHFDDVELKAMAADIASSKRIYLVACGTAYHACLTGKYVLEKYGIPAEAVVASEFRYSTADTLGKDSALIVVSQSGETADTLAAVKKARGRKAHVTSIVNVVGSSITRISDAVIYTRSGPEIAVASTKAYVGQLVSLTKLCLHVARKRRGISSLELKKALAELESVDVKIESLIDNRKTRKLAEESVEVRKFFYIGRNINYSTALEGALKLKEITYLHAEGYAAGELKHGPLAVIDDDTTVIAVVGDGLLRDKMMSNIQEARARGARVITVGVGCDVNIPKAMDVVTPILNIVPLHMFSYYVSVLKGLDPDKPRNLAKSVTVE
ncbi:MAG: glutamine--fructose-6-phosphate transaminase (isomerizing) [Candidatus Altiarchaeota archaeon]